MIQNEKIKNIVLITDYLGINQSANAVCSEEIASYWQKMGDYFCKILFFSNNKNDKPFIKNNIEYIPIVDSLKNRLLWSLKSKRIPYFLQLFYGFVFKIMAFHDVLTFPISSNLLSKRIYNKILEINKIHHIDLVVAFCYPFEGAKSLYKIKKRNNDIKLVYYSLDVITKGRYQHKGLLRLIEKQSAIHFERKIVHTVDHTFFIESNENNYKQLYKKYLYKISFTGIPLLKKDHFLLDCDNLLNNNILYTGSLISRNPNHFLEAIKTINNDILKPYTVTFVGNNDIYFNYDFVIQKPYCSEDALLNEYKNCRCLLNIGNKEDFLIPSKLLRYISTGLPIIHLSQIKNDPCLIYLSKIKNCLVLLPNDFNEINFKNTCYLINNFLINSRISLQKFDGVLEKSTIEYVVNLLASQIK